MFAGAAGWSAWENDEPSTSENGADVPTPAVPQAIPSPEDPGGHRTARTVLMRDRETGRIERLEVVVAADHTTSVWRISGHLDVFGSALRIMRSGGSAAGTTGLNPIQ